MKLDKYLNEDVMKVDWRKLSNDTRKLINKLKEEIDNGRDYSAADTLKDVINNVYQDGYDKGVEDCKDEQMNKEWYD